MKMIVGNIEMHYEISGKEKGQWLVLIHSFGSSYECWNSQMESLNKHFKVLRLDLPGHGGSSKLLTERYSGELCANLIRLLMDKLGISKAVIMGLSTAAIIQQYFCEMFPDRVLACIYASPIIRIFYLKILIIHFMEYIIIKLLHIKFPFKILVKYFFPGMLEKFTLRAYRNIKMDYAELLKWWKLAVANRHSLYTAESNIPALIIAGDKDTLHRKDSMLLHRKYKNSVFKYIKDTGHVLLPERADGLSKLIIEYFSGLDAGYNLMHHGKFGFTVDEEESYTQTRVSFRIA